MILASKCIQDDWIADLSAKGCLGQRKWGQLSLHLELLKPFVPWCTYYRDQLTKKTDVVDL